MPTTYTDTFFVIDPGAPPPVGTTLTAVTISYIDQKDDGFISTTAGDTAGGFTVTSVWVGDQVQVTMGGVTVWVTGVTFYRSGAPAIFTPTDGTVLTNATFVSSTWVSSSTQIPVSQLWPPCFTPGTLIATPGRQVPVECLAVGDLVMTRDHGAKPILWIGRKEVCGMGKFAPIRFAPGVMGNARALVVSPQHRMVVRDWRAQLYFGQDEVLVAAKHLAVCDRIHVQPVARVDYIHLMFDQHEIIFAEGCETESFHAGGDLVLADPELRAELQALFPELTEMADFGPTALPCARGAAAVLLAPA